MTNEYINTILAGLRHCGSDEFCDSCPAEKLCAMKPGEHIYNRAAEIIEELRRKHGRWEPLDDEFDMAVCSECGESYIVNEESSPEMFMRFCEIYKFCPNCGARMEAENVHKTD